MTGLIDDRLTKVLAFEIGTTYGGYTVESRTACFVTFEGCTRKKISIVDGVEIVKFPATETVNGAGEVIASSKSFILTAFKCPKLAETEATPIDYAIATLIKVVEPTIEEVEVIAASLGYKLLKASTAYSDLLVWRLYRDGLLVPSSHYGGGLNLFDVRAFLEAERFQKRFDIEVPSAMEPCYSPTLGHSRCVIRNITECGYAIASLLPVDLDEPDWFNDPDDRPYFDLAGLHAARLRMREELQADSAANFDFSYSGLLR